MAGSRLRFYLTGRVTVEGRHRVDQAALHGRQGRSALVYLVIERHRPVPVDELADALWGADLPASWESSVRAIVSNLRRTLRAVGDVTIASDGGCYQTLLGPAWVDVEAALNALDRSEGARRRGDLSAAWSEATVAASIASRPVLSGEDQPWAGALRGRVRATWVRALDVLADVYLDGGPNPLAVAVARQLVELEPYRESGYRQLMLAHLAAGNRAEAIRAYTALRSHLAEELGLEPAADTQLVYRDALRDDAALPGVGEG